MVIDDGGGNLKKRIRLVTDISMTLLLPLLMAYSLIGEKFHEIAGTAVFILFILHHVMNRKWYGAVFKGSYSAVRVFRTLIDLVLTVFMILQPLSGILISKHIYTFIPVLPVSALARALHMLFAYWGYVLMCIHAGSHFGPVFSKLGKKSRGVRITVITLISIASVYGCIAFVKRGFPGYMTGSISFAFFDYSEPVVFFIFDYLAIMILFMSAGLLMTKVLNRKNTKNIKRR